MSFDLIEKEVNKGLAGKNNGIPLGFDRLNNYVGIRKSMYTLVGGNTGSGKTSFIDDAYVLNPFDWIMSKQGRASGIKLKIIYRSMERSRTYKMAKWVSRRIFYDQGIIIPVSRLLGWKDKMSKDEHDLFLMQRDYIEGMNDIITIIDGPDNPIGIAKNIKDHAMSRGSVEQLDEYNKIYILYIEMEFDFTTKTLSILTLVMIIIIFIINSKTHTKAIVIVDVLGGGE